MSEEQQAAQPVMGINLAKEGMLISVAEPMMNQIVLKWLEDHDDVARMFVNVWIAKQREAQASLAIMDQIQKSKN